MQQRMSVPITNTTVAVDTETTVGVTFRHVIPLMDLTLPEGSVPQQGQRLHSPVVPGERMQKGKKGAKDKNDEDEDSVLFPPRCGVSWYQGAFTCLAKQAVLEGQTLILTAQSPGMQFFICPLRNTDTQFVMA